MLTRFQADILTRYLAFRQSPPTVAGLARRNVIAVGGWLAFLLLAAGMLWWLSFQLGAVALAGFAASTLFHAVASFYRTQDIWPVIDRITDWNAVEQLAGRRRQA